MKNNQNCTIDEVKDLLNFELWLESEKNVKNDILKIFPDLTDSQIDAIIQNHGTFSFMIDHLSEWNGGWPPVPEDASTLPIGCAQRPLANQNSAFPQASPEPLQMDLAPIKDSNTSNKKTCTCESWFLFHNGCKCGGI